MTDQEVSVIIPVFNGARFIGEALQSVLQQDYQALEIIVIDDGSMDDTPAIAQSYSQVKYVRQDNQGVATARNTGIDHSQCELIAFLDADDIWTADKLRKQVNCLVENPDIDYVLGQQKNFLEGKTERPFWLRKEHLEADHMGFLPASLIRRSLFETVGLFNTELTLSEDVEWFARVRASGCPSMTIPDVVLHRRVHDENLSYQSRVAHPSLFKALKSSLQHRREIDSAKDD